MNQFKKTNALIYTKTDPVLTPEQQYWKKLGVSTAKLIEIGSYTKTHISGTRVGQRIWGD
jgi:hypothetical protein